MAMEMSVEEQEQEQETMQAMNEAVGIVEGKEQATLDLLLDMLGRIQKDEMLKKEAEAFVQQVMEEEQAESAEELRRAEAAKAQTDAFEKEWVERVRGKLQVVQEQEGSVAVEVEVEKVTATSAASKSSVLSGWRATDSGNGAKSGKKAQIKKQLEMDDEWAHWAEDDDDHSPTKQ
jgi:hypothetical protein